MTLHLTTTALIPLGSGYELEVSIDFTVTPARAQRLNEEAEAASINVLSIEHIGGPVLAMACIDDRPEIEAACWECLAGLDGRRAA